MVRELFAAYLAQPAQMKPAFAARAQASDGDSARARVVADFIAGMTDSYATEMAREMTGRSSPV